MSVVDDELDIMSLFRDALSQKEQNKWIEKFNIIYEKFMMNWE